MIKRFVPIFVFLIFVFSFTATYSYALDNGISDKADILSPSDETQINAAIVEFEKTCGAEVLIYTHINGYFDAYKYSSQNIVILEIEYEYGEYFYELYLFGEADRRIDYSESDRILDNPDVYDNIKSENFKEGILEFLLSTKKAYLGKYQEPFYETLLISFLIAVSIALLVCGVVVYSYKRKLKSASYPLDRYASLKLRSSHDVFLGSNVTRTRINTSSGSRGGGSRGGGGGSRGRR